MRITVEHLITEGLGYCCPWFFLTRFKKTGVVAARLGVSRQAVLYARNRVHNGEWECKKTDKCMNCKVTMDLRPRKQVDPLA